MVPALSGVEARQRSVGNGNGNGNEKGKATLYLKSILNKKNFITTFYFLIPIKKIFYYIF